MVYKLNVRMCSLFQYSEFGLKYIIFLRCRFTSNYEYAEGSLTFARDVISHSVADKENSESLTSFSKITLGEIVKDLWGERIKHVKRGPRSDLKAAYLNIRRSEGGIRKSLGFTLEEISIPQTWTREIVAPGHYIFSRREKMDFNSQRLILELSVKLSQSFQASYTIRSHGSVVDLESVLRNSGSTTPAFPGQIPCLLQWLENLPICLGFVLEKDEAVVTLSPYTTGQLQDLFRLFQGARNESIF